MYSRTAKPTLNPSTLPRTSNGIYEYRSPQQDKPKSELRNGQFNATSHKLEAINKTISNDKSRYSSSFQNNPILPAKINANIKPNNEKSTFDSVFNRVSNKSETISYPSSYNNDKNKFSNTYETNHLYNKQEVPMEKSIYLNQHVNSNSIMKSNYGASSYYDYDKNPNKDRFDNKFEKESDRNVKFEESNSMSQNFNKIKGGNQEVSRIPTTLSRDIEEEEKSINVKPNTSLYKPYSFEKSTSKSFGSEAKKRSMAGLRNIGNTCFL